MASTPPDPQSRSKSIFHICHYSLMGPPERCLYVYYMGDLFESTRMSMHQVYKQRNTSDSVVMNRCIPTNTCHYQTKQMVSLIYGKNRFMYI